MSVSTQDLIKFVINEARLIDQRRYREWLALYADDGRYWMPLEPGQTEEKLVTSLMYEDKLLLETRIRRLSGDRTFSQSPPSRCQHVLQVPIVEQPNGPEYKILTPFMYGETRGDEQQMFMGTASHTLVQEAGMLKIKLKRVDLLNCDAAHRNIQLFV